ncbi:chromate efflux transporter [Blastomonas sp.]|uniref:chromate efflux transporter n=1 Tax=Blastomonas sp. TaxID=1909299 RepID=UPI002636ED4D|nr:chromate efflux transporter [Blastomonas sp.]MDM7957412.1 chromate efflux transporter [Blastomonas sp.]
MATTQTIPNPAASTPEFFDLLRVFTRIGCLSFGGPAGQIALMHSEVVEKHRWVDEEQYLHALNFCHLLPGPEAQQLATWIGWRLHGLKGGLAAGLLFVIPGALLMLMLSALYTLAANLDWFAALFLGIKAAVLAIVVQALIRIGARALNTRFKQALALAAFLGLFLFNLPFPLVVLGAGALGMIIAAYRPDWLALKPSTGEALAPRPTFVSMGRTILLWGAIWALPLALVLATLGQDHVLWDIGLFFSQLAIVTFGGAYAVLAYMAQEAVQTFGWLQPGEMADGLGLAETTPGPLILVTQHVGFLAAFRAPEPFSPIVAGIIGAALTTWVTFAPCFLWIFTFAPWIERLQQATRLKGGLAALTAAVVGVIANLSVWFALHVLFARVGSTEFGPLRIQWPDLTSLDWRAAVLTMAAAVILFALKWSIFRMLAVLAVAGLALGSL